ncbi:MAG: nucleotide exchange factor GrpE [Burkholderiaceae bacterium]|jgi:molecular chaperone GrpE
MTDPQDIFKSNVTASQTPDLSAAEQSEQIEQAFAADLQQELDAALAKAQANYDLYVRAVAETDNIRRRSADDIAKAHKFAIESFAEALVPVRDSLEAALNFPDVTLESLRTGVEATLRQLASAFEKGRIQDIDPLGEKFDPHRHQAVAMVPGNSVEPVVATGHVVAVLQKGYLIADRILRPALVSVAQ